VNTMDMEPIVIVCGVDEVYIMPLAAMIKSLKNLRGK